MAATRRIFIGLPAYNEEIALPRLLARIEAFGKSSAEPVTVVLYNDGSSDNTVPIAREWQSRLLLIIIDGVVNKGLGAGLRALVSYAVANANDDDALVIMDCDDTHDPAQIGDMVRRLAAGADVVIGSRYVRGALVRGVPPLRRLTALGAAGLFKLIHPVRECLGLYLRISRVSGRGAANGGALLWRHSGGGARLCLHGRAFVEAQRGRRAVCRNSLAVALRPEADSDQDGRRQQYAADAGSAGPLARPRFRQMN